MKYFKFLSLILVPLLIGGETVTRAELVHMGGPLYAIITDNDVPTPIFDNPRARTDNPESNINGAIPQEPLPCKEPFYAQVARVSPANEGGAVPFAVDLNIFGKNGCELEEVLANKEGGMSLIADVPPIVRSNRTFVSIRLITNLLGYPVSWDSRTKTVTVKGPKTIKLTIGQKTYTVNGTKKTMDVAPFIMYDRTMVPLRFIAEGMGKSVTYYKRGDKAKQYCYGARMEMLPKHVFNGCVVIK